MVRYSSFLRRPYTNPLPGKTVISVALAHIFGFGHTQSDDVQAKAPALIFIKNVTKLLEKKEVVIAHKFVSSSLTGHHFP